MNRIKGNSVGKRQGFLFKNKEVGHESKQLTQKIFPKNKKEFPPKIKKGESKIYKKKWKIIPIKILAIFTLAKF